MKQTYLKWGLALILSAFLAGCGSKVLTVDKTLLSQTKRIGIISVVMDKIGGDSAPNVLVRGKILDHAMQLYQKSIGDAMGWEVVPVAAYAGDPVLKAMADIPNNPETMGILMDLANRNQLPLDNEAVFGQAILASMSMDAAKLDSVKQKAVMESAKEIQRYIVDDAAQKYQGFNGLPVITHGMASLEGNGKGHASAYGSIFRKNVATLCRNKHLDGVAVIHIRADITKTGDVNVIVAEGRTKGIIKINPTLVFIASNGQTLLMMGYPTMDDLAPMDVGPPIYIGKPGTPEFRPDFNDAAGRVPAAFNALVDKTSQKLMERVKEAAQ